MSVAQDEGGRPDILAPGASSLPFPTTAIAIVQSSRTSATAASTPSTSTRAITSTLNTPTSTPTPTPSSSPGLSSGLKAVAIAVPIAVVVLLVPLIYLLVRSHQIRKASEQRGSQRYSQQAMIQKPEDGPSGNGSPEAALDTLGGVKPRPRSQQPRQPVNSLGLFNFEFSSTQTPLASRPGTARFSKAFSLKSLHSKKSNINNQHQTQTGARDSKASTLVESAPVADSPASPLNPHFAPLDQIGVAHTRDGRPRPNRSPPRRDGHATPYMQAPATHTYPEAYEPEFHKTNNGQPNVEDRPSTMVNNTQPLNRQPSAISQIGHSSHVYPDNRYSDVSALSDEGQNRRSSHVFPGFNDGKGAQPHGIL